MVIYHYDNSNDQLTVGAPYVAGHWSWVSRAVLAAGQVVNRVVTAIIRCCEWVIHICTYAIIWYMIFYCDIGAGSYRLSHQGVIHHKIRPQK